MTSSTEPEPHGLFDFANWRFQTKLVLSLVVFLGLAGIAVLAVFLGSFRELNAQTIPAQKALGGIRSTSFALLSEYREYMRAAEEDTLEDIVELREVLGEYQRDFAKAAGPAEATLVEDIDRAERTLIGAGGKALALRKDVAESLDGIEELEIKASSLIGKLRQNLGEARQDAIAQQDWSRLVDDSLPKLAAVERIAALWISYESEAKKYSIDASEEIAAELREIAEELERAEAKYAQKAKLKANEREFVAELAAHTAILKQQGTIVVQKTDELNESLESLEKAEKALEESLAVIVTAMGREADEAIERGVVQAALSVLAAILFLIGAMWFLSRAMVRPLLILRNTMQRFGEGHLAERMDASTSGEAGQLGRAFNVMAEDLQTARLELERVAGDLEQEKNSLQEENSLKAKFASSMAKCQAAVTHESFGAALLSGLTPSVGAKMAGFYSLVEIKERSTAEDQTLTLSASFAYDAHKSFPTRFRFGQGLVGQCARDKKPIIVSNVPDDTYQVTWGLGEAKPKCIILFPVVHEGESLAVIALASMRAFTERDQTLLEQVASAVGIYLVNIASRQETEHALTELQANQEELRSSNEELEEQTQALLNSEDKLKTEQRKLAAVNEELEEQASTLIQSEQKLIGQQEELQANNEELEEKNELLEEQQRDIERTQVELERKAEELTISSKYKSEFLANMSHELRTPLNSLLILSRQLADNVDGNLVPKQVEYAETINSAGGDLLNLINEILDLAKIEAGKMGVEVSAVDLSSVERDVKREFEQLARVKDLLLSVERASGTPAELATDGKRLRQLLRNLISNALKFTEAGGITLRIEEAKSGWNTRNEILNQAGSVIAFVVSDTGVGIPPDKQAMIFEAFQQVDGGTSRRYGGTGLGLSISREIARLLGGEIQVESRIGEGSSFTIYLPRTYVKPAAFAAIEEVMPMPARIESTSSEAKRLPSAEVAAPLPLYSIPDDRDAIAAADNVLLIIEDDHAFARILLEQARSRKFRGIVATTGEDGLALARHHRPDAITLDLRLPDLHGWVVLDRLKRDPVTRHIPVHVMSVDEEEKRALQQGAIDYVQKPLELSALKEALGRIANFVERRVRTLLVVEDNEIQRKSIIELIGTHDVEIIAVESGEQAVEILESKVVDCMVVDLSLPGLSGFDLIKLIRGELNFHRLPIVVYTGKELSRREERELQRLTETIIVKDIRSPERLLDETALLLHRVEADLPEAKRRMLKKLHQKDPALAGKKVLIVDDDVRNIFALTSLLEQHDMEILHAENGREGVDMVESSAGLSIVLMDIMMPKMDGYEAMRLIRGKKAFESLPVIALTAKAMKGDRKKCIEAGASDYITKPVDTEQLLSLLRVWLYADSR